MDVLQFLIDKKKIVLAASGSSARKMRTLGTNWLPGRVDLEWLDPLTWAESGLLQNPEMLNSTLLFGALPGIIQSEEKSDRLNQYTQLYLEEEIRQEAQIRNLPKFAKFLQLAALESGTAPNFSKIANQVGVTHVTISQYYQILEDSLIVHRLNAFGNSRDQIIRSPRFYFFDLGVRNSAAQLGHSLGILTLQKGTLFEQFVVLEMIARYRKSFRFHYWRTKQGHEVDLVMSQKNVPDHTPVAIEIKTTQKPHSSDFEGLSKFQEKYPKAKTYLICQCEKPQNFEGHLALNWSEFRL